MRILITGSRDWTDARLIRERLGMYAATELLTVVHGGCPTGADDMARHWAEEMTGYVEHEPHPADWEQYGSKAGPIRNREMVRAGADVCLAFIRNRSKGATGCARLALDAGIELHVWRQS